MLRRPSQVEEVFWSSHAPLMHIRFAGETSRRIAAVACQGQKNTACQSATTFLRRLWKIPQLISSIRQSNYDVNTFGKRPQQRPLLKRVVQQQLLKEHVTATSAERALAKSKKLTSKKPKAPHSCCDLRVNEYTALGRRPGTLHQPTPARSPSSHQNRWPRPRRSCELGRP